VNSYDAPDGTVVLDVIVHDRMFSRIKAGPDSQRCALERWILDPATRRVERITLDHDLQAGTRQTHDFGPGRQPCEFMFVPAHPGAEEDEGRLVGFVINAIAKTTDLVILDARNFEAAPQASIRIPHIVPPGFHGNWVQNG
jgi:carotenoid cleavage dioxygenase-like enzyme